MMAAILDVRFWVNFFVVVHQQRIQISDEKALLTFFSNLSRSLLEMQGVTHMNLFRKCEQHKTRKMALFTSVTGVSK